MPALGRVVFLAVAGVALAAQAPHRAAINALGVPSQEAEEDSDPLALLQLLDPLTAPIEAFMEMPAGHVELAEARRLDAQLEASNAVRAVLNREHQALLEEVQGWRANGARVVERESSLLAHIREVAPSAAASGHAVTLYALPVILLLALLLSAGVALAVRSKAASKSSMAASTKQAAQVTKPILRKLGVGAYTIDISEVQVYVPDVPANSEVCVTLRLGEGGKGLRSKPGESVADSPALSIRDGFHVTVKASDGPCVLSVIDRIKTPAAGIECFGRLELSAAELLRLARRVKGQEFFRFDLSGALKSDHAASSAATTPGTETSSEEAPTHPYVAMRIRDVTGDSEVVPPTGARRGAVLMYSC